jgi:hypothetical protein
MLNRLGYAKLTPTYLKAFFYLPRPIYYLPINLKNI